MIDSLVVSTWMVVFEVYQVYSLLSLCAIKRTHRLFYMSIENVYSLEAYLLP
jgi:hypothetical protein